MGKLYYLCYVEVGEKFTQISALLQPLNGELSMTNKATISYNIQAYEDKYCLPVVAIFYNAIQQLAQEHYSQAMLDKWSESAKDIGYWQKRLTFVRPFLAFAETADATTLVGFIELEADGHIGCLYTHPEWARQGVASCLYQHLEEQAKQRGLTKLYVEASYLSKPLFEKVGFSVQREIKINLGMDGLTSFAMTKLL